MQKSSMRRNVSIVVGLYAISFVVAAGCPATKNTDLSEAPTTTPVLQAAIKAPSARAAITNPDVVADASTKTPPAAADSSGHSSLAKSKFDPVKENGDYFVGWPKPKVAILVSGRQDGYLEPCGCAGLENQKGGIGRRHALMEQLRQQGWPLVAVDVGNSVRRFGKQAEVQFGISVEALDTMGYSAATFGPDDLRLSTGEIAAAIAGTKDGKSLFIAANTSIFGLTPKTQIIEKNGMKIGVTAVLGDTYRQQVNNVEIEFQPAADALRDVVGELADCDVRILLANATTEECKELAKSFPDFDFIVTAEGVDVPPFEPESIKGTNTKLIEVGHKGMYCIVLGVYDDKKVPVRYQRVALDSRFPNSSEMKQLMATYQERLHDLGWSGLGLRPVAHPRTKDGVEGAGDFVGADSCKDCHTKAWDVWSNSAHAHATETLVKADPPRQFDAECISCHATGWNPQEYFPYATGFESLKRTPHLAGNQCENCHGPGGAHVAAESGLDVALRNEQRELMKLSYEDAKTGYCQKCHDMDNSPEFSKPDAFEHYWAEIEHIGKD